MIAGDAAARIPFLCLALVVAALAAGRIRLAALGYALALVSAVRAGVVEPFGVLGLALAALAFALANRLRGGGRRVAARVAAGVAAGLALALSDYRWPGFNNPVVFAHHRFSAGAAPFSMYLNFDKVSAGVFIYAFWERARRAAAAGVKRTLYVTVQALVAVVALLMSLALATRYVRLEVKFPPGSLIWALNNLVFVAFAEECIYRGMIFGALARMPKTPVWGAFVLSAAAFGLAHHRGGAAYVALAAVAGLFYAYAYWRTGRLASSVAVHFGLNVIHFFLFSYPSRA